MLEEGAIHICKNCNNNYTGSFCNICGQKTAHRLDIKHIFHEAVHVFTHTDKGIFSLIPKILFQPGKVALDYVEGKRKQHFNIFQYLLIVVGIVTFIISKTHFMETTFETMSTLSGEPTSARIEATQKEILGFLQKYINLVLFAFIPIFALFSWLFFRSKRYNYAENLVLQVAIQSQISTYSLFLILPLVISLPQDKHFIIIAISLTILIVSFTLAYRQFFKVPRAHAFLKALAVYLCTNVVQILVIAMVMMAITFLKQS